MRLSSIEAYNDKIFSLFKFSKKEYLESLQEGNLYMNNFKYFVDLEKKTGVKGMGDIDEVASIINNAEITLRNHETQEFIVKGKAERVSFRYKEFLNYPVLCLFAVQADMLEIINMTDDFIEVALVFTEKQKEEITKNFGEDVLILNIAAFQKKISQVFNESGLIFTTGLVQYSDFSINTEKKFQSYLNQDVNLFFQKDNYFEYQNEFRIVILSELVEQNYEINIGNLTEETVILKTEDLLNDRFIMQINRKAFELNPKV